MELFTWTRQFETDLDLIDKQHRGLVELINATAREVSGGVTDRSALLILINRLQQYARNHFAEEEAMMDEAGLDPRYVADHVRTHRLFDEHIKALDAGVRAKQSVNLEQMLGYLSHWLAYHILGVDQSMARQIRAVKSGVSAAEAYRAEEERDEGAVGPILKAVNGLMLIVRQRNTELEELNRLLERKVIERTRRLEQLSSELEILAMRDDLTRLENRRSALLSLDSIWGQSMSISAIMLDADHFKSVNDTHGHEAGDRVLQQIARCLRTCFRNDDIISRLGGDEFLIICPETGLEDALRLAGNTHDAIVGMRVVEEGTTLWQGSASIGVAARETHMSEPKHLIRAADRAVYKAKAAGRNCIKVYRDAKPEIDSESA